MTGASYAMAASGCQWWRLPKEFPSFTTVQHYFYRWRDDGLSIVINEALVAANRLIEGRSEAPSAAMARIDPPHGPRGRPRFKSMS
jgi:transposase